MNGTNVDLSLALQDLGGLFIVATLMERGLTALFNWRLYREFFNGRAVKTLVMIAAGYLVVTKFNYDIFQILVSKVGGSGGSDIVSQALSALILAGGSAGVYELFKILGIQSPTEPLEAARLPPENKAWVSVKAIRDQAQGDIFIHFEDVTATVPAQGMPPLAGVIGSKRTVMDRLRGLFLADPLRLPTYGGKTVDSVNAVYKITAIARVLGSSPDEPPKEKIIYTGRFANRAIIDFTVTI